MPSYNQHYIIKTSCQEYLVEKVELAFIEAIIYSWKGWFDKWVYK